MAEQHKVSKKDADENVDVMELEPVKQIEIETKNLVAASKLWIYIIIGLLAYLIFIMLPDINERSHGWKRILILYWFNQNDLRNQPEFLRRIINVQNAI